MMSRSADEGLTVFRYPIGVRVGYPISLLVWASLPVVPVLIWSVIGWTEGVSYRFTLEKYYANPWVGVIFGAVWLWAVYMLYIANLSRSEIRIRESSIGSGSVFGTRTIRWSNVKEVVERRQIVKGKELRTFFVNTKSKGIIFSDGLIGINELLILMNARCNANGIPLFYEDYEVRPITKVQIRSLRVDALDQRQDPEDHPWKR